MADLFRPSAARSWALLLGYVACVLGTLPYTKGLLLTLREFDLLTLTIVALYVLTLGAATYKVVFSAQLPDTVAFFAVVVCAAAAAGLMMGLEIPEERVHFIQYGLMAWLAAGAFRWQMGPARAYLAALLVTCGVGAGDELLQDILPNRVYDPRDIWLNAQAALLGVVSDEAVHNRLGWRTRRHDVARADRG